MASDFNFQFTRVQKTSIILKNMIYSNNYGIILKKGIPDCNYEAQKVYFFFFFLYVLVLQILKNKGLKILDFSL